VLRESAADPAAEFARDNVDLTARVFDAAAAAGSHTFVLVSSAAAVAGPAAGTVGADAAPRPTTPYGASKLAAEAVVRRGATAGGMRALILRPPMVYGPGMKGNPLRLFALIDRGLPLPLGAVHNRRSMLYVGNLVDAIAAALATGLDGTHAVTDAEALSSPEFVRRAARALGRPARLVAVPPVLLRALGGAGDWVQRVIPSPVTSATFASLLGSLVLDDSAFRAATGWRPRHSVDEGLRDTADWYHARSADRPGAPGEPRRAPAPNDPEPPR
jgi:nucleoside-diphosphate-sugar epimerase